MREISLLYILLVLWVSITRLGTVIDDLIGGGITAVIFNLVSISLIPDQCCICLTRVERLFSFLKLWESTCAFAKYCNKEILRFAKLQWVTTY